MSWSIDRLLKAYMSTVEWSNPFNRSQLLLLHSTAVRNRNALETATVKSMRPLKSFHTTLSLWDRLPMRPVIFQLYKLIHPAVQKVKYERCFYQTSTVPLQQSYLMGPLVRSSSRPYIEVQHFKEGLWNKEKVLQIQIKPIRVKHKNS